MNKAMLVESMAKITKLPKATCKECLEAFVSSVGSALKHNKPVVLTGFGTFQVIRRKTRVGINPATGQKMQIPSKKVPKFKPGKALRGLVS
ncbi:HU family DNA-binding protein [Candidatus Babeliales bacterium]|nr:HU family DNA-binding protein [Candidatus Babeliales bacterium]NQW40326.1 HU family DNA-binding protein [Cyanobacteria bacterium bin.275]